MSEPDSSSNPYAPPEHTAESSRAPSDCDFAPILRTWEKLRLWYNGILIPLVLVGSLALGGPQSRSLDYWLGVIAAGLFCNFMFLLGPAIDGYLAYFRCQHSLWTALMFLAGFGLTLIGAAATIISTHPLIGMD